MRLRCKYLKALEPSMKKVTRPVGNGVSKASLGTKTQTADRTKIVGTNTSTSIGKNTAKSYTTAAPSKAKSSDDLTSAVTGGGAVSAGNGPSAKTKKTGLTNCLSFFTARASSYPDARTRTTSGKRNTSSLAMEPGSTREGLRSRSSATGRKHTLDSPVAPKRTLIRTLAKSKPSASKCRSDSSFGNEAVLENRVRDLLGLAKNKDAEILHLRSELHGIRVQLGLPEEVEKEGDEEKDGNGEIKVEENAETEGSVQERGKVEPPLLTADVESTLLLLQEQNQGICGEMNMLKNENSMLKDRLNALGFSLELRLESPHKGQRCPSLNPEPASLSLASGGSDGGNCCRLSQASSSIQRASPHSSAPGSTEDLLAESRHTSSLERADSECSETHQPIASSDNALDAPSGSTSACGSSSESEGGPLGHSKEQSQQSNTSGASVACLTERIHQMEENQRSTTEELQATLQELSDLQQIAQELTVENERLGEEKAILVDSLYQQGDRLQLYSQQVDYFRGLLKEHGVPYAATCWSEAFGVDGEDTKSGRYLELERRYAELNDEAQFERERLLGVQQHLSGALKLAEQDNAESQNFIAALKERIHLAERAVEMERRERAAAAAKLDALRETAGRGQAELVRCRSQLEHERERVAELCSIHNSGDKTDINIFLESQRTDKEHAEEQSAQLQEELSHTRNEATRLQECVIKLEENFHAFRNEVQKHLSDHKRALTQQGSELDKREVEIAKMKDTIFVLEDEVAQHHAVKLHDNVMIADLENTVKKLHDQKHDLEKEIKSVHHKMEEESAEWRHFQADLQTAVVVANDFKSEAQEEIGELRRCLQDTQQKNEKMSKELEDLKNRKQDEERGRVFNYMNAVERDLVALRQGMGLSRRSSTSSEPSSTVKTLIKSFDNTSTPGPVSATPAAARPGVAAVLPRIPLSSNPLTAPLAAAISPMQRRTVPASKPLPSVVDQGPSYKDLNMPADHLMRTKHGTSHPSALKRVPNMDTSKSLSVSHRSSEEPKRDVGAASESACSAFIRGHLRDERKDPLAAVARQYGGSKRNTLLRWCQQKTEGYQNIDITNFSSSWNDGLAFCAILHTYLPAHIPYLELSSQDKKRNFTLAFQAAESVGIKSTLDIGEMVHTERPDWQSVMTYVTAIYMYFET
ncbi:cytospin-A [Polymixia lowei]